MEVKEYLILVKADGSSTSQEIIDEIKEKYGAFYFRTRETTHITPDNRCFNCKNKLFKTKGYYHCPYCGRVIDPSIDCNS